MDKQASEAVVDLAGGAYRGSLNFYNAGGGCMVATVQIDETVYVVGQDDFSIGRYSLDEWAGVDGVEEVPLIPAADKKEALDVLNVLREDTLLWQCGACDSWIHTSNRPRIGILRCSTCGDGGVDFRHADRHVGEN